MSQSVFRFRSLDKIYGHEEIEKQSIFFATLDSLNDPCEGIQELVWNGDSIVWKNFIKNYVFSLIHSWAFSVLKNENEIQPATYKYSYSVELLSLRHETWKRLESKYDIDRFSKLLASIKDISTDELILLLKVFHGIPLLTVLDVAEEIRIIERRDDDKEAAYAIVERVWDLDVMEQFIGSIDGLITSSYSRTAAILDIYPPDYLNLASSACTDGELFIKEEFPRNYINSLDRIIFPNAYVACFSKTYQDSAMWGIYGSSHYGICFEFKLDEIVVPENPLCMTLNFRDQNQPFPMHEVEYENLSKSDFFSILRSVCSKKDQTYWFEDDSGKKSNIEKENFSEDGIKKETNLTSLLFRKYVRKTKDWEQEGESRLLLLDSNDEFSSPTTRALTYPIETLVSITFGIRTPMVDKNKIYEMIRSKCEKNNSLDIGFYQAYHSFESGRIERYQVLNN